MTTARSDRYRSNFPLTDFLLRLIGMNGPDLANADPRRAARTYGLNPNVCAGYIQMEQRQKGLPVMAWEPVEWSPPKPEPTLAQMARAASMRVHGKPCPHDVTWPTICKTCERARDEYRAEQTGKAVTRVEPSRPARPRHWAMLPDDAPDDPGLPG